MATKLDPRASRQRFIVAGLGGVAPVLVSLIAIDLQIIMLNATVLAVLSYGVRVLALFAIGGLVGWLHKNEVDLVKLFQIGIAAPALITAAINGRQVTVPQAPVHSVALSAVDWIPLPGALAQSVVTASAARRYTLPPESAGQQVLRGLVGSQQQNIWFVVAGAHTTREAAQKQAAELRTKGQAADVYEPTLGNPSFTVVTGAQLTQDEARAQRERGLQRGLPASSYLWTFPQH